MAPLIRAFRVLLAGGAFLGFGLGAPLIGLWMAVLWCAGGSTLVRRKRCQRTLGRTFRFFHAYMNAVGLIKYSPTLDLPERSGARILIANHPSLVDVTAILAAYPEACCLVKAPIYDNPLFYLIMKFCGHIRVSQSEMAAGTEALSEATGRLDEGSDVLLFPEGTRSKGAEVGDFRAGAFALAVHAGASLAPIAIFCSRPVLKRGTPWYLIPTEAVTLKLRSLGILTPKDDEPIQSLTARARTLFQDSLLPNTSGP